jgi:hypothetical protein
MLTQEEITAIALLPENCFKYKQHFDNLIALYQFCKSQWTARAVKHLAHENALDLRRKDDRAKFGWLASKELVLSLPPSPTPITEVATPKPDHSDQTDKMLCQAIALLNPVPTTNGLEKAPVYQLMGEPVYLDELVRNYRVLARRWHPDRNDDPTSLMRFQVINEVYTDLSGKWFEKYSPLIDRSVIGEANIARAMAVKLPFTPESFWD